VKENKIKKILFLIVLLTGAIFFAAIGLAQDLTALKEKFNNIRSVKAEFIQRRSLQILTKPLSSEGRLFFYAPDSLRWEYLSPPRSVMLQKGNNIQLYDFVDSAWKPEKTHANESRRVVFSEIIHWFQGRFDESEAFEHFYSPGPPERVILVAKEGIDKFISRIEIVLSARPGVVDQVEIEEPGGSLTTIEFKDVEINSSLSSALFEKP
jgi:outer membrane lipoprotein-sorting protein